MKKKYSIIADFSIIPVGHGETSVGRYVAEALNAVKKVKGLDFEVTPMGTVLEASNLETIFEAVKAAHEASRIQPEDRRQKRCPQNNEGQG